MSDDCAVCLPNTTLMRYTVTPSKTVEMWQIQGRPAKTSGSTAGMDDDGRIITPLEGQMDSLWALWVFWEWR